ncbi:unnamed protein product [Sphenostylis stenocarpa]|uniref:Transmembrane and coiled-coil domain-containing protein 4 n=1 Tax=Sphenostylis stenocarpa TaxID=92480 RepID=A0AA86RX21_9FABA|nr:unnamed protein product [Sphenostylis stenocarpa]
MAAATSYLTPTQRYAAGGLFGLALNQAQLHQTHPLGLSTDDFPSDSESSSSNLTVSEDPNLWVHEHRILLRPVFKYLEIDPAAWSGLEETAGSSSVSRLVGPPGHDQDILKLPFLVGWIILFRFLCLIEEFGDGNSQRLDQELALSKAVDAMVLSLEKNSETLRSRREKLREYEHQCREKLFTSNAQPNSEKVDMQLETQEETGTPFLDFKEPHQGSIHSNTDGSSTEEVMMLSYQRKVAVLYELFSACLSDLGENNKKHSQRRKGYDARHRVTLRLLATWLNIKWSKMEAIETTVSNSAMAFIKEQESSNEEIQSKENNWDKWKRGGIIGAAALTGGTLMAVTGGLAAPAIAAGLGALAPTLGTLIPVIGASGFAAAASAAGTVAGSVAVAASFGAAGAGLSGTKMARRVAGVDEFEFKVIGENHNQGLLGVGIMVSGFVFDDDDFIRPWEGLDDNLERYALQWESKNLYALSTAIQDWLTSRIATELMRQGAMMTVLHGLLTALAWPVALLAATEFIDSIWTIAIDSTYAIQRSDKAGKLLAEVLLGGLQGNRPVTLVGYSLGARVIFKCLECLAETENSAELVERVVLLGAPIAIMGENWKAARKMVAGRFINAYSSNDWMLGVAFRARATEETAPVPVMMHNALGLCCENENNFATMSSPTLTVITLGGVLWAASMMECLIPELEVADKGENLRETVPLSGPYFLGLPLFFFTGSPEEAVPPPPSTSTENVEPEKHLKKALNPEGDWNLDDVPCPGPDAQTPPRLCCILLSQGLAGIQPVDVPGIQNVDVTDQIEGHSSYLWATQQVLDELELDAYYPVFNNTSKQ